MHSYLQYDGMKILAHRGGAIESFENTLESFRYSVSIGCDYIETDVQLSSDGVPYIFHDDDLKRIVGKKVKFNSMHSNDINQIKIFDNLKIPTLEEALIEFKDINFQIDVKTDEVAFPAIETIIKHNAVERVCIASFNSGRLKKIRNKYPQICTSMGPKEVIKLVLNSFNLYTKEISGECLQVPIYYYGIKVVTKRFIDFVQSKGLKIIVWTINDESTFKELQKLNVDGIITDIPKKFFEIS